MKRYYYDFLLMLQVLTRVPINKSLPCESENFKNGANFFVLIGLLIGLSQYVIYILLSQIIHTSFSVIAIIIFDILITGALHIDGFGDTCDGFFAFKGKDRIIEIMKDSRIGAFACIGIVLNLLIKYQGYLLIANYSKTLFIILIPILGRFSIVLLSYIGKAAKEKGSGNLFINTVTLKELVVNTLFVLAIGFLLNLILQTIILLVGAIIITILFNLLCNSKINGVTGDSLGAINELVVLISLIMISSVQV